MDSETRFIRCCAEHPDAELQWIERSGHELPRCRVRHHEVRGWRVVDLETGRTVAYGSIRVVLFHRRLDPLKVLAGAVAQAQAAAAPARLLGTAGWRRSRRAAAA